MFSNLTQFDALGASNTWRVSFHTKSKRCSSIKEVTGLKQRTFIYQAENHSSFTGRHARWRSHDRGRLSHRRRLLRAAIICVAMILLSPAQLCCLPPQLVGRCWLWILPKMAGYTHTHIYGTEAQRPFCRKVNKQGERVSTHACAPAVWISDWSCVNVVEYKWGWRDRPGLCGAISHRLATWRAISDSV